MGTKDNELVDKGDKGVDNIFEGENDTVRVLVADDDKTTLMVLSTLVESAGYSVETAVDGDEAYKILSSNNPPDIALLDWMMPGKNGIELCGLIKEFKKNFVYTILVTGKNTPEDMVIGLEAGAHEFLSKPVKRAEFVSRIGAGARIVQYKRDLEMSRAKIEAYAHQMELLAHERARQLVHAERIATLGMMSAGIAHEINNPSSYISANAQTLERFWPDVERAITKYLEDTEEEEERLKRIKRDAPRLLESIKDGVDRISKIVRSLKRFSRQESRKREEVKLAECIEEALEISANTWKYDIKIDVVLDDLPKIEINSQEITQVLVNLIVNSSYAIKRSLEEGAWGQVNVNLYEHKGKQRIVFEDDGPGIPDEILKNVWNPFFTTKLEEEGTGLGLSISRNIIEEHGGEIAVMNRDEGGARFIIDLPS